MFNPEAELEKEECRREGAVVEVARAARRVQRAYDHSIPFTPERARYGREHYEASKALEAAVDALEQAYRGEYE